MSPSAARSAISISASPSEEWRMRHRRLAAWFEEFGKRKSMQLTVPRDG